MQSHLTRVASDVVDQVRARVARGRSIPVERRTAEDSAPPVSMGKPTAFAVERPSASRRTVKDRGSTLVLQSLERLAELLRDAVHGLDWVAAYLVLVCREGLGWSSTSQAPGTLLLVLTPGRWRTRSTPPRRNDMDTVPAVISLAPTHARVG